ncbi:ComF family protein [Arvimicrobium flavum]|uniref:ComF family protein n=1 Tax=Arvimicrobium flavum TaxID=3393320 RepID=UPI00237BD60C|nr:ComF family protein [Mesorhizobium shangrilense]
MDDRDIKIKTVAALGLDWAANILFPPACPGCRLRVSRPATLCGACWPRLRFLERPWCEALGTPFDHDPGEGALSPAAIADPPAFDRARAAVAYGGIARQLVQELKYGDRTDLAPWMARWMLRPGEELFSPGQLVVPVPLHWRRFISRRFNQSAELARALARMKGLAFAPEALRRVKLTRQQVGLGRRERTENVRAAFQVPDAARAAIAGAPVLLVDDVYTTGATVSSASKALKRAGAARVDVLTFARVLPGDFLLGDQDLI